MPYRNRLQVNTIVIFWVTRQHYCLLPVSQTTKMDLGKHEIF